MYNAARKEVITMKDNLKKRINGEIKSYMVDSGESFTVANMRFIEVAVLNMLTELYHEVRYENIYHTTQSMCKTIAKMQG